MKVEKYPVVALRSVSAMPGVMIHFDVDRKITKKALDYALENGTEVFAVMQKDKDVQMPGQDTFYPVGVIAKVKQTVRLSGETVRVTLEGMERGILQELLAENDILFANVEQVEHMQPELKKDVVRYSAFLRNLQDLFRMYVSAHGKISSKMYEYILQNEDLEELIDLIAYHMPLGVENRQLVLCEVEVYRRYYTLSLILDKEIQILHLQNSIRQEVQSSVTKNQKEYYLREEIKAIHKELGDEDVESDLDRYRRKLAKLDAPKKVKKKIKEELKRFSNVSPTSSESVVIRTYVETLLSMPWKKRSHDNEDIAHARAILDDGHYGMKKVKERVVEYLAVRSMTGRGNSPIICLVGPPGTGKTSVAKGIAQALGKKYVRICLGGVRDEAEIRGHRRTYVGAMAGRLAKALQNAKVKNPLILLDEIDKLGSDVKGDPSSALLEVLDAEQNKHFTDHYLDVPLDLSEVMFVCTANTTDTIPRPLLDRLEMIEVPGYTANEKFHIAKEHLWKKQLEKNGLTGRDIKISDKAIQMVIASYTKEAGVRELERKLAALLRKAATKLLEGEEKAPIRVSERNIKEYLGKKRYEPPKKNTRNEAGIVRGLAWTAAGGVTLEIEAIAMPGKGEIILTGQMGDVMQESAKIALSYVRMASSRYKVEKDFFDKHDFHIHIPEGATPKDGPSAGITMALAIFSAVTGQKVYADLAMTGELALTGRILPIGGLKEKLLAAKEAGITKVLVPKKNAKDVEEIEEEITTGMDICYVESMREVFDLGIG